MATTTDGATISYATFNTTQNNIKTTDLTNNYSGSAVNFTENGDYIVYAAAYKGGTWSSISSITFTVDKPATPSTTQWELVDPADLVTGDVVLIVDKTSACAMSNDNGTDAAPSATSVTLNSDKSLVTAGVTAALQWKVTNTNGTYNFTVPGGTTYLYCTNTNNGLRVGTGTNNDFIIYDNNGTPFLKNEMGTSEDRYIGVYSNQDWRCYKSIGDNIASTVVAFYKKVELGAHSVAVASGIEHGSVSVSPSSANAGGNIIVTVSNIDAGYELTGLSYNGTAIDISSTPYTFTMPDEDVTVTATFSQINYNIYRTVKTNGETSTAGGWLGRWNENCTLPDGATGDSYVVTANYGASIQFMAGTNNNYEILPENITAVDADGNPVSLNVADSYTTIDNDYGRLVTFTMPASPVTITANFTSYVSELYILGTANGNSWAGNLGVQMKKGGTDDAYYTRRVYFAGNATDGAYGYFNFTESLGNADWSNMGTRYGSKNGEHYDLEAHGWTGEMNWWDEHKEQSFKVPAGIYDIVVNKVKGQVTVTRVEPEFTFSPAAGEVNTDTEVTATSTLGSLLHKIDSNVAATDATTQVSLSENGTYGASVTLNADASVYARATYGQMTYTSSPAAYTVTELDRYQLITSTDDLVAGETYLVVGKTSTSTFVMSTEMTGTRADQIATTPDANGYITASGNMAVITLGGSDGAWTLSTSAGFVGAKGNGTMEYTTTAQTATISFNDDNNAIISLSGNSGYPELRYNNSSHWFACYASTSGTSKVFLYKKISSTPVTPTVATPTFSVAEGTYSEAQSVEINCSTSGATILYSTDGTNFQEYTSAITVDVTTTLYAKATKEGYNPSAVASATYTINIPVVGEGDFVLVTNANQISTAYEYIMINSGRTKAASSYISEKSRIGSTDDFTLGSGNTTASAGSGVMIYTLEDAGDGEFYLKDNQDNYYTPGSGSSADVSLTKTALSVSYDGGYVVIKQPNASRKIGFNTQTEQFGSFSSTTVTGQQTPIYLYYREKGLQKPVFTPAEGVYGIDVEVSISCPTSGATILYSTDGTNFQAYTEAITVSETTTLYAKAVKGEQESEVVSAIYTISKSTDIATVTLTYSEPLTEGVGYFYVVNEGEFSPVWTLDGNYGIKGTSYHAGTNYAATSWFISPLIDMTDAVQPELTFSHQINSYFTNPGTQCTLWIREGSNGAWQPLNGLTFSDPAANGGWTNDFADIDLSDYAGKTVQIGFKYNNPVAGTGAGTWNIQYFYVADNSEYKLVNNIAEFLAQDNGEKAKFRNPVTVLYDYSQHSSNTYQEYIWVKDESGYTNIFLAPSLDGHYNTSYQRAYYENGDVIPAGFVVVKNYYENGGYIQAMANPTSENEYSGFLPATQKALADPEHFELSTLDGMATDAATVEQYNNRYISFNKVQIVAGSGKNFTIKDENGNTIDIAGYNKYSDANSLLKDGTTAVVTLPTDGGLYNVTAILQTWKNGWEVMPITFTPWEEKKVTLRELCASGVTTDGDNHYTISNNLLAVYANDNVLWLKDDTGQSIQMTKPASDEMNYPISETDNTRQDQAFYDQSNWLQVEFAAGFEAEHFVNKIINGGAIKGNFTDKLNPTLTGATALTDEDIYAAGSYANNFYCMANFAAWPAGADHLYQTAAAGVSEGSKFFFMNPKPQEYATIAYAVWMGNDTFVIPAANGGENGNDFAGAITVAWDYNAGASARDLDNAGVGNQVYKFNAIIKKAAAASGAPRRVAGKDDQSASGYVVYPTNLTAGGTSIITAVDELQSGKAVDGVRYVNVAGQVAATPWQGVNIVVTRYTDGSTRTTKVVK